MKNMSTRYDDSTNKPNQEFSIVSESAEHTKQIGQRLIRHLNPDSNIGLFGELGAGKTQLVKGIARGLHIEENDVVSPGFGLINVYNGDKRLYHVDLYRLESPDEISTIGLDDYIFGEGLCVIEWADRLKNDVEFLDLRISFDVLKTGRRILTFQDRQLNTLKGALKPLNRNRELQWR